MGSIMAPWRIRKTWMLLQRRQASLSIENRAASRWAESSEASQAAAASFIPAVDSPVFCTENSPGVTWPSAVSPLKGSAICVSALLRFSRICSDMSGSSLRPETTGRFRILKSFRVSVISIVLPWKISNYTTAVAASNASGPERRVPAG